MLSGVDRGGGCLLHTKKLKKVHDYYYINIIDIKVGVQNNNKSVENTVKINFNLCLYKYNLGSTFILVIN